MSGPYRDATAALRRRVEALGAELERLHRCFSGDVWRLISQERLLRLQRLRARAKRPAADDPKTLRACLAAREVVLRALNELRAELPALEESALKAPAEVPDVHWDLEPLSPALMPERWQALRQLVQELDPSARFAVAGGSELFPSPFQLTFRALGGVPFKLFGPTDGMCFELRTSVAWATPALRLEPEQLRHSLLLKPLGIVRETELGDFTFDGLFLVHGAEGARMLLGLPVRQALTQIARHDVPQLDVGDGLARLRWNFQVERQLLLSGLRALAGVRRVPLRVQLWREPT
jgi:hypothetical protein